MDSQIITLADGQQVGLATYGADDGFPILALHGAPASRIMYDVAGHAAMQVGFKLFCPDRPGYGLTPPAEPVTLGARVDLLAALVDALGFERFGILGISGGGPYATALAARFGDRVAVLGLVSPLGPVADYFADDTTPQKGLHVGHRIFFLDLQKHPTLLKTNAKIAANAFKLAPRMFAAMFVRTQSRWDREILRQPHVGESIIAMTKEALRQGVDGAIADLEIFGRPWAIDFCNIHAPTVIWQGTSDRIVPVAATRYLSQQIPDVDLVVLPEAGHFWIYNHIGEMFAGLVRAINRSE